MAVRLVQKNRTIGGGKLPRRIAVMESEDQSTHNWGGKRRKGQNVGVSAFAKLFWSIPGRSVTDNAGENAWMSLQCGSPRGYRGA